MGDKEKAKCQEDQVKVLISEAIRNQFYGKLTIQFTNGEVVLIRREETLKVK